MKMTDENKTDEPEYETRTEFDAEKFSRKLGEWGKQKKEYSNLKLYLGTALLAMTGEFALFVFLVYWLLSIYRYVSQYDYKREVEYRVVDEEAE